jgi:hypothetical protein
MAGLFETLGLGGFTNRLVFFKKKKKVPGVYEFFVVGIMVNSAGYV